MYQAKQGLDLEYSDPVFDCATFDYDEDEQRAHYFNMEVDRWAKPWYNITVLDSKGIEHVLEVDPDEM